MDAMKAISDGEKFFAEGKLDDAEASFRSVLEEDPSNAEALNNLGVLCQAKGKSSEARYFFEKTLCSDGNFLDALVNLATLAIGEDRWSEARRLIVKALSIDGTNHELFNHLALVCLEMKDTEGAAKALSQSLELHPHQEEARKTLQTLSSTGISTGERPKEQSLKILFVQEAPCIRNYKMATALRARGHSVTLAYTKAPLSKMYPGLSDDVYSACIKLKDYRHLWDISRHYDIIHCHNEPDTLTVAALACQRPVVHDTHDLISLRANGDLNLSFFEGIANRGASGRVYTTPYQMEEARRLYGIEGPSLVMYNYVSRGDLPDEYLPKLSDRDGGIHIVYEGGIGGNSHRNFIDLFTTLADHGVHIHIYPTAFSQQLGGLFAGYGTIHYYEPLSPKEIMRAMTQYDFGIIPFNLEKGNKRFLDSTIANKLFEYLAAGLPVLTSPLATYIDYFETNPVGLIFNTAEEIIGNISRLTEMREKIDFARQIFTYENEIHRLERFYRQILHAHIETPFPRQTYEAESSEISYKSLGRAGKKIIATADLKDMTKDALLKLHHWILSNGWRGYDPYDIPSYILGRKLQGVITEVEIQEIQECIRRDPEGGRKALGIEPQVNAKAMGLFLSSYADLSRYCATKEFHKPIEECLTWLLENPSKNIEGLGWGYPFDWESVVMIPKGVPTSVNSYHIGDGFWKLHTSTDDGKWLSICLNIADFFTKSLNRDIISDNETCFSYTPLDFYHVHNANLSVSEFLIRLGKETASDDLVELGMKGLRFAFRDLQDQGFLTYWARGYEPSPQNIGQIDHYHSAAELRCLYRLMNALPDHTKLRTLFERYLSFYHQHFFHEGTVPKIHPARLYPINIHAAAEAAYILGETAVDYPASKDILMRFLPWLLNNFRNGDGSFGFEITNSKGKQDKNMFPFLRWGQAWAFRGLTTAYMSL
ncbi:MAG: glycosyltransferase [Deltaproteobacteria bacterium]|nr:glycosyltransferase [Deltaproteobacteria bacterium]